MKLIKTKVLNIVSNNIYDYCQTVSQLLEMLTLCFDMYIISKGNKLRASNSRSDVKIIVQMHEKLDILLNIDHR